MTVLKIRRATKTFPANEEKHIDELLAIMRTIQERKDRKEEPVPRDVHPKQHGCIRAELSVEPGLPDEYRRGVFTRERTFAALVRFSNAKQRDDRLPDGHGMAIKLVGVEGQRLREHEFDTTTQDFVLIDHPVFFARDAAALVPLMKDFQRLMIGGITGKLRTVLKAMLSRDHRYRLLRRMGAKRPDNPLEVQYWARHRSNLAKERRNFPSFPGLQLRPPPSPIQDLDTPERRNFGENLSFSPWHGISEHRPLGSINRARRKIYETMAARRLDLNDVPKREPTPEQVASL